MPGDDGDHAHAVGPVVVRQRAHEVDEAGLGGGVGRRARLAVMPGVAGDGDDHAAPGLDHRRQRRLHGEEGALEVGLEHAVPVVLGDVERGTLVPDAGAVDEHVELPVALHRRGDERPAVADGAHVAGHPAVLAGRHQALGDGLRLGLVPAGDHDRAALHGEAPRAGLADARRPAGDQNDLVGKTFHGDLPQLDSFQDYYRGRADVIDPMSGSSHGEGTNRSVTAPARLHLCYPTVSSVDNPAP